MAAQVRRVLAAVAVVAALAGCGSGGDERAAMHGRALLAVTPFFTQHPCSDTGCGTARIESIDHVVDNCTGDLDLVKQLSIRMAFEDGAWTVPAYKAACPERVAALLL